MERDRISESAAVIVHSSREILSVVEKEEVDGEKAEGAASRKVDSKRGWREVYSC
jgi:hypothetical protein